MKRRNRNSRGIFWYLFTLLSFGLGVILYIFIRRNKKDDPQIGKEAASDTKKVSKPKQIVNKNKPESIKKLSKRQEVICAALKKQGSISTSDLSELVPDVSVRTLRRDMDKLEKLGIAQQKGSTKSTYYKYIEE